MSNLFKRFFTHKSKFLLIILCLLGLTFSYSCSCRNESTGPKWGDDDKKDGNTLTGGIDNGQGGKVYTPGTKLSRTLMVVNSKATDTSYPIGITVTNADYTWEVSGDLVSDTFEVKDGNLKVKGEKLGDITAKKSAKLTINYKKNSEFGDKDTLSKDSDTFDIEVTKAENLDKQTLGDNIRKAINAQFSSGKYIFTGELSSTSSSDTTKISIKNNSNTHSDKDKASAGTVKELILNQLHANTTLQKYFEQDGIKFKDGYNGKGTQSATFTILLTPKPEYEIDIPQSFILELDATKGEWVD
ncbi:hypothetical protein [Brachyspira sp.]|uniref:hypothetical protein n=1 Tax=Brachyspira sp. TaxID=1977261 RepID=UPI003D7CCE05